MHFDTIYIVMNNFLCQYKKDNAMSRHPEISLSQFSFDAYFIGIINHHTLKIFSFEMYEVLLTKIIINS